MKELLGESVESIIVKLLQKGSLHAVRLIDSVRVLRPYTTKQSVYLALRNLKKREIVILANKTVSLDHLWIKNMKNFFGAAESIYTGKDYGETFLSLQDGEALEYKFKSPLATDMFWAHAFSLLFSTLKSKEPIFLYNPHQWFLLVREKTEKQLMQECRVTGHPWLQIIGNKSPLDTDAHKEFKGTMNRCQTLSKAEFPDNYYVNIFSDFLIEVWLDKDTSTKISSVYKANVGKVKAAQLLSEIVANSKGRNRLRITRNLKKAEKVRRIFKKYFIF